MLGKDKMVLFVCVGNSGRSQMAEAFFNRYAGGQVHALSAGTKPASRVDPTVIAVMKELGIDLSGNHPKPLTRELLDASSLVITMGCGAEDGVCPASWVETRDWGLTDPKGKTIEVIRGIRDDIRNRVLDLLNEIGVPPKEK
jgi:protein-tyrosine-phosphatase